MIFLLSLPFRFAWLGFKVGAGTAKLSHRTVRFVGYRRLLLLGIGMGIGLLLAPVPGEQLREKLRELLAGLGGSPPMALAERVREELAASPRTWHLPQPGISIDGSRVTLSGDVPHATAAADLERTVRDVKGVTEVDNKLRINT